MDNIKLRSELETKKRRLAKELKSVEGEIHEIDVKLLDEFGGQGIGKVSIDDFTFYINRKIVSKVHDKEKLIEVLKNDVNLSYLIKENYNTNTLNSAVNDLDQDDNFMPIVPDKLKGLIEPYELFQIRARSK